MRFLTLLAASQNNRVDFVYKLDGELTEINVFDLAPTLLALGQLIQDSHKALHPDGPEIAVNVKPFKQGSFVVDIVLFPTDFYQALEFIKQYATSESVAATLIALGIIAKKTKTGADIINNVLEAIRALRGKPKKVEDLKQGEFRYTSADNKTFTVNKDVHTLIQNNHVTNNMVNVYAKPLERENVDSVQTYLKEDEETKVVVPKSELPALKEFAQGEMPSTAQERVNERVLTDVHLNPKRGAFEGDGSSWSFHRGSEVITASVKDEGFLKSVETGEIRPNHHDLMTVTMIEKQKVVGTEVKTPTYEIVKVDHYELGFSPQMNLLQVLNEVNQLPTYLESDSEVKSLPPAPDSDSEQ